MQICFCMLTSVTSCTPLCFRHKLLRRWSVPLLWRLCTCDTDHPHWAALPALYLTHRPAHSLRSILYDKSLQRLWVKKNVNADWMLLQSKPGRRLKCKCFILMQLNFLKLYASLILCNSMLFNVLPYIMFALFFRYSTTGLFQKHTYPGKRKLRLILWYTPHTISDFKGTVILEKQNEKSLDETFGAAEGMRLAALSFEKLKASPGQSPLPHFMELLTQKPWF